MDRLAQVFQLVKGFSTVSTLLRGRKAVEKRNSTVLRRDSRVEEVEIAEVRVILVNMPAGMKLVW